MSAAVAVLRRGPVSWLVPVRAVTVTVAGVALLGVLVALDLAHGDYPIPLGDVVGVLLGGGDEAARLIVLELRLPQTVVAMLAGAALALSGALTQTFARNPLASPDILGVTEGAAVGAVAFIVLTGTSSSLSPVLTTVGLPAAALSGGLVTATAIYLLSWRSGIDGQRLVLIGIGAGAMMSALTSWLLVVADLTDAASASVWLTGSLNARGWDQAVPLLWTLVVAAPVAFALSRTLRASQLGDDTARALGVRLQLTQAVTLVAAVALAAVAVSACGPIEFVAFVVPQVALRLARTSQPPLVPSMVYGACLVVGADLVSRVLLPFGLPAGLVTAAIGAPYLIWLLLRANRKVTA